MYKDKTKTVVHGGNDGLQLSVDMRQASDS